MIMPLFLTVIVLYTGCRKQEAGIVQNNIDIAIDNIPIKASAPVLEQEKTVKEPLEAILKNEKTSVVMYLIPFDMVTRFPMTEDNIKSYFQTEIHINRYSIYHVESLILTAYQKYLENSVDRSNIRLLIDVLFEEEIVYTIPISDGLRKEVLEAFQELLGLRSWVNQPGW